MLGSGNEQGGVVRQMVLTEQVLTMFERRPPWGCLDLVQEAKKVTKRVRNMSMEAWMLV